VRTIKKVVKTATVEHKKWKQEMHRFLRNFRATPHTTTKIPPATALFGRALKTKLPELKKTLQDPAVEDEEIC
jgi:hypothetical protein